MRKGLFVGISALALFAFAVSAQAQGDCGWSGQQTVSTSTPVVAVDSATTTKPTTTKSGG
jgi:hypothetical protein